MSYKGRFIAVGIVGFFKGLEYIYYNKYVGAPFTYSFLVFLALSLVLAWWGGRLFDRAQHHSVNDPLTELYNRRIVPQHFQKLVKASQRTNETFGVMLIDLDNFKEVNDQLGHRKGDELLRHVTIALKKIANKKDVIIRWGGDEFVILIPNINKDFLVTYLTRLQAELLKEGQLSLSPFGVSVGLAIYPEEGESFDELFQRADTEMYKMKNLSSEETVPV